MDAYKISNGFAGMMRDIVLRVCKLIWHKPNVIRMIFGMCLKCYEWRGHPFFQKSRPSRVQCALCANPEGGCSISPHDNQCSFIEEKWRTVVLNFKVTRGIFRWTIRIRYGLGSPSEIYIGALYDRKSNDYDARVIGSQGLHSLHCSRLRDGSTLAKLNTSLSSSTSSLSSISISSLSQVSVPDNSLVSVEMDTAARTLSFFINDEKVPFVVSNIFAPVRFGVSGRHNVSFTSLHLCRLLKPTPTPSTVTCTPCTPIRLCRCRECPKFFEGKPKAIYCSQTCQNREQNIRTYMMKVREQCVAERRFFEEHLALGWLVIDIEEEWARMKGRR